MARKKKATAKANDGQAAREADRIMAEMAPVLAQIEKVEAEYNAEAEALAARYQAITRPLREDLSAQEKTLTALIKRNAGDLFGAPNRQLILNHGAIDWSRTARAIRRKGPGVLEKIKEAGLDYLVKIVESVDWDRVDLLDDATLEKIGTERKEVDKFGYELKV